MEMVRLLVFFLIDKMTLSRVWKFISREIFNLANFLMIFMGKSIIIFDTKLWKSLVDSLSKSLIFWCYIGLECVNSLYIYNMLLNSYEDLTIYITERTLFNHFNPFNCMDFLSTYFVKAMIHILRMIII